MVCVFRLEAKVLGMVTLDTTPELNVKMMD